MVGKPIQEAAMRKGQELRHQLLQMREELLDEAKRELAAAAVIRDEGSPDIADAGLTDDLREFLHLLSERQRDKILDIDDALLRLDAGSYGTCEDCGNAIDTGRIKTQPYTRYCLGCQRGAEAAETLKSGITRGTL